MEDRRRRGISFEKLGKEMLRYLEKSETQVVNGSTTELQERLEVPVQIGISISKWPSRRE